MSDGTESVTQTVNVNITAENDAPFTEVTSSLSVTEDGAASGTITATDIDGDTLSYTYSAPSKGTIVSSKGSYIYTPTVNATGADSFTVTVSDGTESVTQTVNVNITAENDTPITDATSFIISNGRWSGKWNNNSNRY